MGRIWCSAHGMKQLATGLLFLALVAIAALYAANQKAIAIQGPGALQVMDGGQVWLGVNDELWTLDGEGRRTGRRPARDLGFTEAVSNIVPAPDGQALLTSRGDLQWRVVDRKTLAPVRTITPQWPADFKDNYLRAIHLAISPAWDIAVATGGGHTVLLFDREGRYKSRTAAGTYYFTNGLWWAPEGWWTTDTNRSALHLLDTGTLAVKSTVRLPLEPGGYTALGELVGSQGRPQPGSPQAPFATVTRLGFLMEPGHAVDVFADGSQLLFNKEPLAQLRDMAWLDGHLLLVDGGSYRVLRFGSDRLAEPDFGEAQVQRELGQMFADRQFWSRLGSRYAFLVAAFLLLSGIAAYARHRRLAALAVVEAREMGRTAAQRQGAARLVRQRLWIFGLPAALRIASALAGMLLLYPALVSAVTGTSLSNPLLAVNLFLLSVFAPVAAVAAWQQSRHQRLMRDPRYEATLNHRAIAWLALSDDSDRVREEGESPRESILLPGWRARWLVVTNRRVLLFVTSARERRLSREWPRRGLVFAGSPDEAPGERRASWWRALLLPRPNLLLCFADGERLRLRCASTVTARRAAQLLMQGRPAPRRLAEAARPRRALRRRWHEVLASFALPGAGQWLQGRFASGTVMFTAAALLTLLDWGPVAWASDGPKMHVDTWQKAAAMLAWLLLAAVAAADAFHFSAARKRGA